MRRAGWKRPLGVLLGLLVLVLGLPAAAQAQPAPSHPRPRPPVEDPAPTGPDCTTTPSTTQPGYSVADPRCVFNGAAYTGARVVPQTNAAGHPISRTFTGILAGAIPDRGAEAALERPAGAVRARLPRQRHHGVG